MLVLGAECSSVLDAGSARDNLHFSKYFTSLVCCCQSQHTMADLCSYCCFVWFINLIIRGFLKKYFASNEIRFQIKPCSRHIIIRK